jgi:hypothetical protein
MTDPHLAEQFPLSPADDLMIHQTPDPIRTVWTSDLQAYERFWMVCHDDDGHAMVAVGVSFYPNLDAAEAYAIVNVDGRHGFVRAFRRLGADRTDMRVGPIHPTVVAGLRHWHYEVADNEWDVRIDVDFFDTTRQVLRTPMVSASRSLPGRQGQVTAGFEGFGVVEGRVSVGDRAVTLSRDTARGSRDRHWGTGRGVGGPAFQLGKPVPGGQSGNAFVNFARFGIWGDRVFYPFGDERPGAGHVVSVHRRLRFEHDTRIFCEAVLDYELGDGSTRQLHVERLGFQTAYLRCGMYGGSPDGRYQGVYPGEDVVEGAVDDVTDPFARSRLAGLDEHQCRITCDGETVVGVFQPIDPAAYDLCHGAKAGWGLL